MSDDALNEFIARTSAATDLSPERMDRLMAATMIRLDQRPAAVPVGPSVLALHLSPQELLARWLLPLISAVVLGAVVGQHTLPATTTPEAPLTRLLSSSSSSHLMGY